MEPATLRILHNDLWAITDPTNSGEPKEPSDPKYVEGYKAGYDAAMSYVRSKLDLDLKQRKQR